MPRVPDVILPHTHVSRDQPNLMMAKLFSLKSLLRDAFKKKKIEKFGGFVLNWLTPYPPPPIWDIKI